MSAGYILLGCTVGAPSLEAMMRSMLTLRSVSCWISVSKRDWLPIHGIHHNEIELSDYQACRRVSGMVKAAPPAEASAAKFIQLQSFKRAHHTQSTQASYGTKSKADSPPIIHSRDIIGVSIFVQPCALHGHIPSASSPIAIVSSPTVVSRREVGTERSFIIVDRNTCNDGRKEGCREHGGRQKKRFHFGTAFSRSRSGGKKEGKTGTQAE